MRFSAHTELLLLARMLSFADSLEETHNHSVEPVEALFPSSRRVY